MDRETRIKRAKARVEGEGYRMMMELADKAKRTCLCGGSKEPNHLACGTCYHTAAAWIQRGVYLKGKAARIERVDAMTGLLKHAASRNVAVAVKLEVRRHD